MLIVFGAVMLLYVALGFAMAVLTSQMMVILHGDAAGTRLERQSEPMVRWYGIVSIMGYHPLNPYLWVKIVRASDLPPSAQGKQRQMRVVFAALLVAFVVLGALVLFGG